MTPDQILGIITALLSSQPDAAAFDRLASGGYDTRYPVVLEACPRPLPAADIEGQTVVCGRVDVPENHSHPDGNRIDLAFALLKARSLSPAPDPVIYLHGGPGGRAVPDIAFNAGLFDFLRERRDLVLFDQRASGISAQTVACTNTLADNIIELARDKPDETVPQPLELCLAEVEEGGAVLKDYNTTQNAHDVRAIMTGLGFPVYNAYGVSYGTKLGLELLRSDPEGLRAMILDSISPPDDRAYDTNGVPTDLAIGAVVDQCAADAQCSAAFPDFEKTLLAVADKLKTQPFPATATRPAIDDMTLIKLFSDRNSVATNRRQTSFIPAIVSDWANGSTQLYDLYVAGRLTPPQTPDSIIAPFIDKVPRDQLIMGYAVLNKAEELRKFNTALEVLLQQVSAISVTPGDLTQLETALDAAISAALPELDPTTLVALAKAYGHFVGVAPDKAGIVAFVEEFIPEPRLGGIRTLIAAMSASDVEAFYARARKDTSKYFDKLSQVLDLAIYACQEDIPFNSREGFEQVSSKFRFPFIRADTDSTLDFYEICDKFTAAPRAGFNTRVYSDLPVLALAGLNDIQTSGTAAEYVAATMANGQAVTFPEAGHGVIQFSQCAKDIVSAFVENPLVASNTSCVATLTPQFVVP